MRNRGAAPLLQGEAVGKRWRLADNSKITAKNDPPSAPDGGAIAETAGRGEALERPKTPTKTANVEQSNVERRRKLQVFSGFCRILTHFDTQKAPALSPELAWLGGHLVEGVAEGALFLQGEGSEDNPERFILLRRWLCCFRCIVSFLRVLLCPPGGLQGITQESRERIGEELDFVGAVFHGLRKNGFGCIQGGGAAEHIIEGFQHLQLQAEVRGRVNGSHRTTKALLAFMGLSEWPPLQEEEASTE